MQLLKRGISGFQPWRSVGGLSAMQRDILFIFKQIDAKLSTDPGIPMPRLTAELSYERHIVEQAVKTAKSMSFREYQQQRRVEAAIRLLADKQLLIKQIAGSLGYASQASLWRLLKRNIKTCPSHLRALNARDALSPSTDMAASSDAQSPMQLKLNFNIPFAL
jgi:transcriptional regulator GlxA family with amidase domain